MLTTLFILAVVQIALAIISAYLYTETKVKQWIFIIPLVAFLPFVILGACSYGINILPMSVTLLCIHSAAIFSGLKDMNLFRANKWRTITFIMIIITIAIWVIFGFIWAYDWITTPYYGSKAG